MIASSLAYILTGLFVFVALVLIADILGIVNRAAKRTPIGSLVRCILVFWLLVAALIAALIGGI